MTKKGKTLSVIPAKAGIQKQQSTERVALDTGFRRYDERGMAEQSNGGTHSSALLECGVEGDLAYQVGTFAITGTDSPEQGRFVNVLKRQPDGTWKVAVTIFDSDRA